MAGYGDEIRDKSLWKIIIFICVPIYAASLLYTTSATATVVIIIAGVIWNVIYFAIERDKAKTRIIESLQGESGKDYFDGKLFTSDGEEYNIQRCEILDWSPVSISDVDRAKMETGQAFSDAIDARVLNITTESEACAFRDGLRSSSSDPSVQRYIDELGLAVFRSQSLYEMLRAYYTNRNMDGINGAVQLEADLRVPKTFEQTTEILNRYLSRVDRSAREHITRKLSNVVDTGNEQTVATVYESSAYNSDEIDNALKVYINLLKSSLIVAVVGVIIACAVAYGADAAYIKLITQVANLENDGVVELNYVQCGTAVIIAGLISATLSFLMSGYAIGRIVKFTKEKFATPSRVTFQIMPSTTIKINQLANAESLYGAGNSTYTNIHIYHANLRGNPFKNDTSVYLLCPGPWGDSFRPRKMRTYTPDGAEIIITTRFVIFLDLGTMHDGSKILGVFWCSINNEAHRRALMDPSVINDSKAEIYASMVGSERGSRNVSQCKIANLTAENTFYTEDMRMRTQEALLMARMSNRGDVVDAIPTGTAMEKLARVIRGEEGVKIETRWKKYAQIILGVASALIVILLTALALA